MNFKIKRIVSILCLAAAICSVTLLPASGYAETLRFVFLADSRGNSTSDLINTDVLNAINIQILALSPKPSFVIFGGDQAYRGYSDGAYNFQAFKDALQPLTAAGIKLYTALGNHELYNHDADAPGFRLANQTAYQTAFVSNPANGPSGYERLVYSFESPGGDAFFAVLDPYYLTADVPTPNVAGTVDATQLSWLTGRLALTKATHKFLFIHPPYYYMTLSPADISFSNLWYILDQNRFDIYFCGHTHLYSRKNIDSSIAPSPQLDPAVQWKSNVFQVLNGTCGAPVDPGPVAVNTTFWHVSNAPNTYYFSVVDISRQQRQGNHLWRQLRRL